MLRYRILEKQTALKTVAATAILTSHQFKASNIKLTVVSVLMGMMLSSPTFAEEIYINDDSSVRVNPVNVSVLQRVVNPDNTNTVRVNNSKLTTRPITMSLMQDSLQNLIDDKQRQYFPNAVVIDEQRSIRRWGNTSSTTSLPTISSNTTNSFIGSGEMDYNAWLNRSAYRVQEVNNYQRYLQEQLGAANVPPMEQLLTSARDWQECGYEQFQIPPRALWKNIVPTLKLYSDLKQQHIIPDTAQIRSVYRPADLNACAGGATHSKHLLNAAVDIWVPEYEEAPWSLNTLKDNLCSFQNYYGKPYHFGLGLYATGAIHLDTQGYRRWGQQHTSDHSVCRIPLED